MRLLEEQHGPEEHWQLVAFRDLDGALEWAEDQLLSRGAPPNPPRGPLPRPAHRICYGLSPEQVENFGELLEPRRFDAGETILRRGERADRIYFLVDGELSVVTELLNGELRRLSTLARGIGFGELAAVTRTLRSADVRADEATVCHALSVAGFERLSETHPEIKLVVRENLLRGVNLTVARRTHEVATLAQ